MKVRVLILDINILRYTERQATQGGPIRSSSSLCIRIQQNCSIGVALFFQGLRIKMIAYEVVKQTPLSDVGSIENPINKEVNTSSLGAWAVARKRCPELI